MSTQEEEILHWLIEAIARETRCSPGDIDPDKSVHTLGIDSALVISLTFDLGDRFGVELNPTSLFEPESLRAFARELARQIEGKKVADT